MKLTILAPNTRFTYKGMKLKKGSTLGPCDPDTNKATFPGRGKLLISGIGCPVLMGGQYQDADELLVWVPEEAEVLVGD